MQAPKKIAKAVVTVTMGSRFGNNDPIISKGYSFDGIPANAVKVAARPFKNSVFQDDIYQAMATAGKSMEIYTSKGFTSEYWDFHVDVTMVNVPFYVKMRNEYLRTTDGGNVYYVVACFNEHDVNAVKTLANMNTDMFRNVSTPKVARTCKPADELRYFDPQTFLDQYQYLIK